MRRNNIRASIQGKEFWNNQLHEINSALDWELAEPRRQVEWNREMNQMLKEDDQFMEETYQEFPGMRPSTVERQAEALRRRADQIEQQELDRFFKKESLERIAELRSILPVVESMAK